MSIKISDGFKITGEATSIDTRFVLSKSQMATTLDPDSSLSFYLPKAYFAACKDDGKLYLYSREHNPASEETGYFKQVVAEGLDTTVYQGVKLEGETDSEAITRILNGATPIGGDVIILKTLIEDDKYSYKSFVYNNGSWKAMDGNYDASNVYFDEDIVTAGNYTQVGNITKTQTGTGTIEAAGKSVKEILTKIFTTEINPTTINPSLSISATTGAYEVGTKVTPTYTLTFNSGSYTYGPTPTGSTATSYSVEDTAGHTSTASSGSFDEITVGDGTSYKITGGVSYTAGSVPKTNLNNDYPAGQIKAGTATNISSAITGYRSYFYGCKTEIPETVDSDLIRSLTNSSAKLSDTTTFTMPVADGTLRVYIAFPTNSGKTLTEVKDEKALNKDIHEVFTKSVVSVKGLNDYAAINYDVYTYAPKAALSANNYAVTIK